MNTPNQTETAMGIGGLDNKGWQGSCTSNSHRENGAAYTGSFFPIPNKGAETCSPLFDLVILNKFFLKKTFTQ